jgi:hypothetical protein
VIPVCVRVWGVHVRLIGNGVISTIVPGQCDRSAFARGVYFFMISWHVSVRLESVQYFYSIIWILRMEEYLPISIV